MVCFDLIGEALLTASASSCGNLFRNAFKMLQQQKKDKTFTTEISICVRYFAQLSRGKSGENYTKKPAQGCCCRWCFCGFGCSNKNRSASPAILCARRRTNT